MIYKYNTKHILITILILCSFVTAYSQINFEQPISIDTAGSDPNEVAILDLKSTDKGILIPRMTSMQRTAITGTKGLMVYDTDTDNFWFHDGTEWSEMGSGGASTTLDSVILGNGVKLKLGNPSEAGLLELNDASGSPGLHLYGKLDGNDAGYIEFFNSEGVSTAFINADDNHDGARMVLRDSSGVSRIQLNTNYQSTEDARIITDEIEIRGGSDLAELFDINRGEITAEPGMVVTLDPEDPGKLRISSEAYDQKIVGVISGANGIKPGILMGQDQTMATGHDLVTLSGRTYIKANLKGGEIKIGDFITSSDIPGEAMKAKNKRKAKGAIIGKAMTPLNKDSGYVLVLVSLQ